MVRVSVGLIFRNMNKEILLCQRRSDQIYPFEWEFPGGKIQNGENLEQCLERELWEELNIKINKSTFYHKQTHNYLNGLFEINYFIVHGYNGVLTNKLFNDVRWIKLNCIEEYKHLEGNIEVIQKLLKDYGKTVNF